MSGSFRPLGLLLSAIALVASADADGAAQLVPAFTGTGGFRVREGRGHAFEKLWAGRNSRLGLLKGFLFFVLMRRAPETSLTLPAHRKAVLLTTPDGQSARLTLQQGSAPGEHKSSVAAGFDELDWMMPKAKVHFSGPSLHLSLVADAAAHLEDTDYIATTVWDGKQSYDAWRGSELGSKSPSSVPLAWMFNFARDTLNAVMNTKDPTPPEITWHSVVTEWREGVVEAHQGSYTGIDGMAKLPSTAFVVMCRYALTPHSASAFEASFTEHVRGWSAQKKGLKGFQLLRRASTSDPTPPKTDAKKEAALTLLTDPLSNTGYMGVRDIRKKASPWSFMVAGGVHGDKWPPPPPPRDQLDESKPFEVVFESPVQRTFIGYFADKVEGAKAYSKFAMRWGILPTDDAEEGGFTHATLSVWRDRAAYEAAKIAPMHNEHLEIVLDRLPIRYLYEGLLVLEPPSEPSDGTTGESSESCGEHAAGGASRARELREAAGAASLARPAEVWHEAWRQPPCSLSPCATEEDAWLAAWQERFACWWVALPAPTQAQLGACFGALGLSMGSRLESAWRRFIVSLRGDASGLATSASSAQAPADKQCEWLNEGSRLDALGFPEMPEFPYDFNFRIPPIPRMLPNLEQLKLSMAPHEGLHSSRRSSAPTKTPRSALWVSAASGALVGIGAALTFTVTAAAALRARSRRATIRMR